MVAPKNGDKALDEYSFARDLLDTWRATSDWIKFVVLVAVPGYLAFFFWLVLMYAKEKRSAAQPDDDRIRELVDAEMCRIIAEWERARLAGERQERLPGPPRDNPGWRQ